MGHMGWLAAYQEPGSLGTPSPGRTTHLKPMSTTELRVTQHTGHVLVDVHVVPRASRSKLLGVHDGRLKISLAAPPVDGAANEALVSFIAKLLSVPLRDVTLARGESSRQKQLRIQGVTVEQVRALGVLP